MSKWPIIQSGLCVVAGMHKKKHCICHSNDVNYHNRTLILSNRTGSVNRLSEFVFVVIEQISTQLNLNSFLYMAAIQNNGKFLS